MHVHIHAARMHCTHAHNRSNRHIYADILHAALNNCFKVSLPKSEVLILGPADDRVKALCDNIRDRGMVVR